MSTGRTDQPLVLLIGGASGTGKTSVAAALSKTLSAPHLQADDFRLFAQRITSAAEQPDLHYFVRPRDNESATSESPEALVGRMVSIAELVSRGLEIVIAHHLATDMPLIIEGDAILPALAAAGSYAGRPSPESSVRAIFLHEPDEAEILRAMRGRGRGIEQVPPAEQERFARVAWLYGRWLAEEAARHAVPVIRSRPHATLVARVREALR